MQADHVIALCRWQSTFDQGARAVALQDFISHWSNSVLREELNRSFDQRCPPTQTWRIETLRLDLGDIALDELPQELPRRLRACLSEALDQLQAPLTNASASAGAPSFQILDQTDTLAEFVTRFLAQGSAPWWYQGERSAVQQLDRLLLEHSEQALAIIRELGRTEAVRRRMVWQLGEPRLRRIVHLLEPWQGGFVCAYADQLFLLQSRQRVPDTDSKDFRTHTWLSILSYLLVDRGTLFNTAAFIRAGLLRTAQRYGMAPATLLEQMFQAVQALRPLGMVSATFMLAIENLYWQDTARPAAAPMAQPQDLWLPWQAMLRHSQAHQTVAQQRVAFGELFATLARQDPERMARILRQEGGSAGVRQGMLRHLGRRELALAAQVLAPLDHLFIVAHAEYTEQAAALPRWDRRAVWAVLLAYLLLPRGSYFNQRQLVRDTVLQICDAHGYQLAVFLDVLMHSVPVAHPSHQHYELLTILRELRGERARTDSVPHAHPYRLALLHCLQTGRRAAAHATPSGQRMLAAWLADHGAEAALAALLRAPELSGLGDALLSRRLLGLTSAADLPSLFHALDPQGADFCLALLANLLDAQRRGALPSLAGIDLALHLPALLIQALPAFHQRRQARPARFESGAYWRRLCKLLRLQARVNIAALQQQLQADEGAPPAAAMQPALPDELPAGLPAPQATLRQWADLLRHSGCWQGADAVLERELGRIFWDVARDARPKHLNAGQLLARMTLEACRRLQLSLPDVIAAWRGELAAMPSGPWHAAQACLLQLPESLDAPEQAAGTLPQRFRQDHLGHYLGDPRLPEIIRHLLRHGGPPGWLDGTALDLHRLLHDLFHLQPGRPPALLHGIERQAAAEFRLLQLVPFAWLGMALRAIAPEHREEISLLEQLHHCVANTDIPGASRHQREALLLQLVLRHGLRGDWAALAPEQLAGRFVWQLMRERPVGAEQLSRAWRTQLGALPDRLRLAMSCALDRATAPAAPALRPSARPAPLPTAASLARLEGSEPRSSAIPMRINNAGLVLLQSYIRLLFGRLGLTLNDAFVSADAQRRAVHCLQFLVTGKQETPEQFLALNKLLCGLKLQDPVELSIDIGEEEMKQCDGLLKHVIEIWPDAGRTSIDGLRGNWLVRDGSLTDAGDHWAVIADRRSYDVLLARLPLSYSVIKFPWMEKAVYVTWPT